MTDLASVDYVSDPDVSQHPYPYWDRLREQGPVVREPHYGAVAVSARIPADPGCRSTKH
jgi:hypothetical protein